MICLALSQIDIVWDIAYGVFLGFLLISAFVGFVDFAIGFCTKKGWSLNWNSKPEPVKKKLWAKGWTKCRRCNTRKKPHHGRGYCNSCYHVAYSTGTL